MTRYELDKKLNELENMMQFREERIAELKHEFRQAQERIEKIPRIIAELESELTDLKREYRQLYQVWKEREVKTA